MRALPLVAILVACNASPPNRSAGATPSDPCTVACQSRKDHCHMLPSIDDCVLACHTGDSGVPPTKCHP
jgi:hypothetical protein